MIIQSMIDRIKEKIPHLKDAVAFYNDGTVYYSTLSSKVNIPLLGKELSESIYSFQRFKNIYTLKESNEYNVTYKKIVYEYNNSLLVILKLGQDSNLALYIEGEEIDEVDLGCIREDLKSIEDLIDTTEEELEELGYEAEE